MDKLLLQSMKKLFNRMVLKQQIEKVYFTNYGISALFKILKGIHADILLI
jgi:hypothetical protein